MRINFDFLDLEAFLIVKETASFHAAAERLNLSQSSVTRRIQKLEVALGTELFERTTRDVRPTLAAKRLQLRAEAILQGAQETTLAMRDETAAYEYQRAQTVTIATVPTVIPGLVSSAIRSFRAAGQKARIRLLDLSANDVAEAVAQGDADFGICSTPMYEPSTEFELLFSEPLVLAVHKTHRLSQHREVVWGDLSGEDLILPARGTGNRLLIDEALASSGERVLWTYEVGRSTSALELVSGSIGVALLPKSVVVSSNDDTVSFATMTHPTISRPIGLLSRTGHSDTSAAQALKASVREQLAPV